MSPLGDYGCLQDFQQVSFNYANTPVIIDIGKQGSRVLIQLRELSLHVYDPGLLLSIPCILGPGRSDS